MYLLAYDINGTSAFHVDSYTAEDLNGNSPFKISQTIESGYINISTIGNWWWFYEHDNKRFLDKDYKFYRHEILLLANIFIGWDNLTQEEKELSASIFAVDKTKRDQIYNLAEQIQLGKDHHYRSLDSRKNRVLAVELELFNRLSKEEVQEVFYDIKSQGIYDTYIEMGNEGIQEGDSAGLFDYTEGSLRTGTPWSVSGGFYDKGFTPIGMTMTELTQKVMDILKNGNY